MSPLGTKLPIRNVRSPVANGGKSGQHLLVLSITGFDPKQTLGRSDVLLPFWARWPIMAQPQFRTIQVCLKDLLAPLRQVVAEVD
jgi:hypothetical protein